MPLIVDKDAVKEKILMAFQNCIEEKPLANITLRDIAEKAEMSHPNLLYYFKNKHELVVSYAEYTRDYFSQKCVEWFEENDRSNFASNADYLNKFMEYVAVGKADENRPNATTQLYVYAQYDKEIGKLVREEFWAWKKTMEECLVRIYGQEVGAKEAEVMMILISGTFICNYNNALTGAINSNILGYIGNLTKS
ncbi:MAG: TetR/AcrR family transcriptional regulator [Clostridiales bacterium]|jgi:AcrR family transcriptional regulator|nr:TetR/AcrR family transcriptional regulator [Clostridiales bacterium]